MTDRCWRWAAVTMAAMTMAGCVAATPSHPAPDPGRDDAREAARSERSDPNQYIRVRPYRDRRGDVWLTLTNTAPVTLRDVSVSAQYRDPKGRIWNYSTSVSKISASGGVATIPTSFNAPEDKALRGVSVRITRAQVE